MKRKKATILNRVNPSIKKLKALWIDKRTFKQRISFSILMSLTLVFMIVIFGSYDLYVANLNILYFSYIQLFNTILILSGLSFLGLTLFLGILKGTLFDIGISIVFSLLLGGVLQSNFFNISLGLLTGDAINWHLYSKNAGINALIWLALIILPFIIRLFSKKVWQKTIALITTVILISQVSSFFILIYFNKESLLTKNEKYLSADSIYEVGEKDNIIIIVLDRLDERYIDEVLEDEAGFFKDLTGFTRFTNNISTYSQTFPSVVNMLTGKVHLFDRSRKEFMKEAWESSTFIPALKKSGYVSNLYMEEKYTYWEAQDLDKVADNIAEGTRIISNGMPLAKALIKLSIYRHAPFVAKPFLWMTTDDILGLEVTNVEPPPYTIDDIRFFKELEDKGLSPVADAKVFNYIHLKGPHAPYIMDERAQASEEATYLSQTKGSFYIVFEYLKQLKDLELYDDATIIITGDHGARKDDTNPLEIPIVTALFVKPANAPKLSLQYNNAPVHQDNLRPTLIEAAGLDHKDFGQTYFEISPHIENERVLYQYLKADEKRPRRLLEYIIKGDAKDFNNWHLVSEVNNVSP